MMDDDEVVKNYIERIKKYPPLVSVANKKQFFDTFLGRLDQLSNIAMSFEGKELSYEQDGQVLAGQVQEGNIGEQETTEEFWNWYLTNAAEIQAVLKPGQTQAEDFSIVDEGFYDSQDAPNTRFPQRPETQGDSSLIKQGDKSLVDKGNKFFSDLPVGPITQKVRDNIGAVDDAFVESTVGPAKRMFQMLKSITRVGE